MSILPYYGDSILTVKGDYLHPIRRHLDVVRIDHYSIACLTTIRPKGHPGVAHYIAGVNDFPGCYGHHRSNHPFFVLHIFVTREMNACESPRLDEWRKLLYRRTL